ncbi:universal stress protein [Paenibacillus eucommiae]|uniref:Nucleotide-binding universal stress UspA family protein n=1 Tax=Paenibacillus eucommiae TaxID=1355755 RepID=A0ABS4J612_9BACL|nr:universal stress protein [Paenibacillus eucommiae]MBP1995284.1 nucleotide-binding universal stress UspA family protein [Paenibacillus eucommiae]
MLFSKILVAYDGSNLSKKALYKAVAIALENHENGLSPDIMVIHVRHDPTYAFAYPYYVGNVDETDAIKSLYEEAKQSIPPTININYASYRGQPASTILKYAEKNNCDLIVMGSRGLGNIREFFLGSVSHHVTQNSKVPVLIIK